MPSSPEIAAADKYIYALRLEGQAQPFYIGQTHNLGQRKSGHFNTARLGRPGAVSRMVRHAWGRGEKVVMDELAKVTCDKANDTERRFIEHYSQFTYLLNSKFVLRVNKQKGIRWVRYEN